MYGSRIALCQAAHLMGKRRMPMTDKQVECIETIRQAYEALFADALAENAMIEATARANSVTFYRTDTGEQVGLAIL